jgi:hypothetical protein
MQDRFKREAKTKGSELPSHGAWNMNLQTRLEPVETRNRSAWNMNLQTRWEPVGTSNRSAWMAVATEFHCAVCSYFVTVEESNMLLSHSLSLSNRLKKKPKFSPVPCSMDLISPLLPSLPTTI